MNVHPTLLSIESTLLLLLVLSCLKEHLPETSVCQDVNLQPERLQHH